MTNRLEVFDRNLLFLFPSSSQFYEFLVCIKMPDPADVYSNLLIRLALVTQSQTMIKSANLKRK